MQIIRTRFHIDKKNQKRKKKLTINILFLFFFSFITNSQYSFVIRRVLKESEHSFLYIRVKSEVRFSYLRNTYQDRSYNALPVLSIENYSFRIIDDCTLDTYIRIKVETL